MTKTLTEQWRDGTLPDGEYYVKTPTFNVLKEPVKEKCIKGMLYIYGEIDYNVEEVLAPVPSHSEYQALKDNCELTHTRLKGTHQKIAQLEKKLDIALKALKFISSQSYGKDMYDCAREALKKIEELDK